MSRWDIADRVAAILAILVGVTAGTLICVVLFEAAGERVSSMPAWVQAIGSVFAIAVAITLSGVQSARQRDLLIEESRIAKQARIAERMEKVEGAVALMQVAARAVQDAALGYHSRLRGHSQYEQPIAPVERMREAVLRIPLHEAPYCILSREMVYCAELLDRLAVLAKTLLEHQPGSSWPGLPATLDKMEGDALALYSDVERRKAMFRNASSDD